MPDALTYDEVGATLAPELPRGYHHLDESRRVGDASAYDDLVAFVLGWGLQRESGIRVPAGLPDAAAGLRTVLRLGPLRVPVEVVAVVDEPDRGGFVYGTLPGHPECGEELFSVERRSDGTWIVVRAFSRPGRWFTRLGAPLTGLAQRAMTERYLRAALRRAARA